MTWEKLLWALLGRRPRGMKLKKTGLKQQSHVCRTFPFERVTSIYMFLPEKCRWSKCYKINKSNKLGVLSFNKFLFQVMINKTLYSWKIYRGQVWPHANVGKHAKINFRLQLWIQCEAEVNTWAIMKWC